MIPFLLAIMMVFGWAQAFADDKPVEKPKPPSCQDRLNDATVLSNILSEDRNRKDVSIAKMQVLVMQLRQRNDQLEHQVIEMQKALAPKVEAPPAEKPKE